MKKWINNLFSLNGYDGYEKKASKIFLIIFFSLISFEFLNNNKKLDDLLIKLIFFSGFIYMTILFERSKKLRNQIEYQKQIIEEKQKEIIESINYAKYLQQAILPSISAIDQYISNNFIIYRPKDVVAGDFYWAEAKDNNFFIAVADSTGHGVPGAMVSVVCSNALNRSVNEFEITDTGKILDKTRELVLETFAKGNSEVKDGMDISLLCINNKNKKVYWSGANNSLWFIKNGQLSEIKADKQSIGKTDLPQPFKTHEISYEKDSVFYLFTDGYADQFGGPKGKKFKYKQLAELISKNSQLSMQEQSLEIENAFNNWKGDLEQIDDVCIIGIKI
jgi:serine phosphatase RsbU (regulator of sigma subunit)